jgi:NADH-quinone oxidoreductase subunit I
MYGTGILKGLGVTLRRFIDTYISDLEWAGTRTEQETFEKRQGTQAKGINTVEYPDEKMAVPERFRFIPFLVVNNHDDPYAPSYDWCTSCGICAKVCPPQCIWIVRGKDPDTGRPKPEPEAFYIDIDICMNCGYCAEYCPFDAIKMDHDYELSSFDRTTTHIYDKKRLSKEVRYWQTIAPTRALEEAEARGQWEHKDMKKVAKKQGVDLTDPVWDLRDQSVNNPDLAAARQAQAAAAAAPQAAPTGAPAANVAPAQPQTTTISIDVEGADWDQLAKWSSDDSLPLEARAAAAVKLEAGIKGKEFKPAPSHRKAVSAAKKAAKAQDTTIDDIAANFQPGQVIQQQAAAPQPTSAQQPPASPNRAAQTTAQQSISIDVDNADWDQLAKWSADESLPLEARAAAAVKLEAGIKGKEFKPGSEQRKALSAAKKAAKAQDKTIDDIAAGFSNEPVSVSNAPAPAQDAVPPTPATAAEVPAEPQPTPAATGGASVDTDDPTELANMAANEGLDLPTRAAAAVKLQQMIKDKTYKPPSEHRKALSQAKKAAKEAGTTIEDAAG